MNETHTFKLIMTGTPIFIANNDYVFRGRYRTIWATFLKYSAKDGNPIFKTYVSYDYSLIEEMFNDGDTYVRDDSMNKCNVVGVTRIAQMIPTFGINFPGIKQTSMVYQLRKMLSDFFGMLRIFLTEEFSEIVKKHKVNLGIIIFLCWAMTFGLFDSNVGLVLGIMLSMILVIKIKEKEEDGRNNTGV